jgi:hypothetical protein
LLAGMLAFGGVAGLRQWRRRLERSRIHVQE